MAGNFMTPASMFAAMQLQKQQEDKQKQQDAMLGALFQHPANANTPGAAATNALSQILGAYMMNKEREGANAANEVQAFATPGGDLSTMQGQADQQLADSTNAQLAQEQNAIQSQAAQALSKVPVSQLNPEMATTGTIGG